MPQLPSLIFDRLRAAYSRMPSDLAASLLMILALVTFTVTGVFMRLAAETLPVLEILFLRQLMALAIMAPLFWNHRGQILHPDTAQRGISGAWTRDSMIRKASSIQAVRLGTKTP